MEVTDRWNAWTASEHLKSQLWQAEFDVSSSNACRVCARPEMRLPDGLSLPPVLHAAQSQMWEKRWRTAEREERRSTSVAKAAREELEEAVRLRLDAEGAILRT